MYYGTTLKGQILQHNEIFFARLNFAHWFHCLIFIHTDQVVCEFQLLFMHDQLEREGDDLGGGRHSPSRVDRSEDEAHAQTQSGRRNRCLKYVYK